MYAARNRSCLDPYPDLPHGRHTCLQWLPLFPWGAGDPLVGETRHPCEVGARAQSAGRSWAAGNRVGGEAGHPRGHPVTRCGSP